MYHSVLTSNRFTNEKMANLYNKELINIGNIVLYNNTHGTTYKYNKSKFIRIKNLVSIISDEYYKDTYVNKNSIDILLNKFNNILKS